MGSFEIIMSQNLCMCVCVLMYTELTSPLWGFSEPMKQSTEMNKLKRLRIPTSGRSISWLCASAAEELNHGQPGTNSAGGQSGSSDFESGALTTLPRCLATIQLEHSQYRLVNDNTTQETSVNNKNTTIYFYRVRDVKFNYRRNGSL